MSRACVLLVNWNGWADTIECLESLFRSIPNDARVIVCDNGSSDGSIEKITAWAQGDLDVCLCRDRLLRENSWPPVAKPLKVSVYDRKEVEVGGDCAGDERLVLIRTGENLGFAGGNNVGLRYLLIQEKEEYIWLLNNDTVIAPGALDALVRRMAADPGIGMCGSTLLRYEQPDRVQARAGGWYCNWIGLPWNLGQLGRADDQVDTRRIERQMNYVVGASLCISRTFLEEIGLMCEDYFLFYEELDWALRAKSKFRLGYAADSIVYHKVGQSIGTSTDPGKKSYLCDYYALRNRLLFTRRFYSGLLPFIYLSLCCALLLRACYGKWDRVALVWRLLRGKWDTAIPTEALR